ncbi:MAG: hypothetical protein ACUVQ0_04480 [Thermoproteota archaeon]
MVQPGRRLFALIVVATLLVATVASRYVFIYKPGRWPDVPLKNLADGYRVELVGHGAYY